MSAFRRAGVQMELGYLTSVSPINRKRHVTQLCRSLVEQILPPGATGLLGQPAIERVTSAFEPERGDATEVWKRPI